MLTEEQKVMLDTVYPAASEDHGQFLDAELLQLAARVAFGDEEDKAPIADAITLDDCKDYLSHV